MKSISFGLLLVLTLALFGHLLQRACEAVGIPFLTVTVLRDALLLILFLGAIKSVPLLQARWLIALLLMSTVFFAGYIFISVFENSLILGFYYLRLYLLPILFFVTAKIALQRLDHQGVHALLRGLLVVNGVMVVTAIALYLIILLYPQQRALIFGASFVPYSWLAAGEGGTLMRMGLPMTSPNHLGLYFGLMLYLFLVLAIANPVRKFFRTAVALVVVLNMAGLAATFSRSSMVMVLTSAVALLVCVPALRRGEMLTRGLLAGLALVMAMTCGLAVVELASDGFVSRWLALNLKAQDPSILGHWQSLVDAYQNFELYYLYGYPRGTVGPRAFLFYVNDRFNVENSVLSAVYDFGVIGAALFCCGYYWMVSTAYRARVQLALCVGFVVCIQFLPYLFEPVVVCLFLFVYLLLGALDRLGYFESWRTAGNLHPAWAAAAVPNG